MASTTLLTPIFLLLFAAAVRAGESSAKPAADPDEIKLVEIFIQTPVSELPEVAIPKFLSIDSEALPKKLRKRFTAKRLELHTLKQNNGRYGMIAACAGGGMGAAMVVERS